MHIVDARPGDISLHEIAGRADCAEKTVRRAIAAGELPRRYVVSPRGPQLVFSPAEVKQWLEVRSNRHQRRSAAGAGTPNDVDVAAMARRLAEIGALAQEQMATIGALQAEQFARDRTLADVRATIVGLAARLNALEATNSPPPARTARERAAPAAPRVP
jgi:hypothetical protein